MARQKNKGPGGQKQEQGKRIGGGAGKKKAYRSRYYGSTYVERKLKRLLQSNGSKAAREWAEAHQKDYSAMWALDRFAKAVGPSENSDATKIGRLAKQAMEI